MKPNPILSCFLVVGALSLDVSGANTLLKVELGGFTGEIASSPSTAVHASTNTAFGHHEGAVDFGFVAASSGVSLSADSKDPGLNAISTFVDNFTVTSPGIASFVRGTMVVTVSFQGGVSLVPSELSPGDGAMGVATYRFRLMHTETIDLIANGFPVINETGRLDYDRLFSEEVVESGTVPPVNDFEIEIPFKFGIPTQIKMELMVSASGTLTDLAPAGASLHSNSSFASGARWTGVKEIRHHSGSVITDYSIATASGVNWVEPSVVYLSDVQAGLSLPNELNERFLELTLVRRTPQPGLQYLIEASHFPDTGWSEEDPGSGEPLTEILEVLILDADFEQVRIRDKIPFSNSANRFLRIQAMAVE